MINRLVILFGIAATLSAAPQLVLSTTSLGPFQILPGANGPTQTVQAQNTGTGSLNLTAAVSASWLTATIGTAKTCPSGTGTCNPIAIALNTSSLAAGTYTGFVLLTDPNAIDSPQSVSVSVNIAGVPSSVTLYVTPTGGPTPTASLRIYTSGTGNLTGTATTQSGGNWLSLVNGAPFFNGYAIQVVAQAGEAPGTYTGTLVLSGSSTQTINVTQVVTNSPIIPPVTTPVVLSGSGGNASAVVSFSNGGAGTLDITSAAATSSSGNFLSASVSSPNSITITATPGSLAAGFYAGSVTITSNAANNSQISVPVVYQAEAASTPLIYSGGVTNIGNFTSGNGSPGEILAIFGDQLAPPGTSAQNPGKPPLATTLGMVQVLVNGAPAPLYFVSPGQVNFQLPYEAPVGQVSTIQVVSNGTNGNLRPVNVVTTTPVELIWPAVIIPGGYAIAVNTDNSIVLPAGTAVPGFAVHPAKVGDTLTIYCTAFGQTSPPAVTGAAATSSPLEQIQNMMVTFGGGFNGNEVTVPAAFAGLTPTAVGLYQVNVQIPSGVLLSNAVPIMLSLGNTISNIGVIPISQ